MARQRRVGGTGHLAHRQSNTPTPSLATAAHLTLYAKGHKEGPPAGGPTAMSCGRALVGLTATAAAGASPRHTELAVGEGRGSGSGGRESTGDALALALRRSSHALNIVYLVNILKWYLPAKCPFPDFHSPQSAVIGLFA